MKGIKRKKERKKEEQKEVIHVFELNPQRGDDNETILEIPGASVLLVASYQVSLWVLIQISKGPFILKHSLFA